MFNVISINWIQASTSFMTFAATRHNVGSLVFKNFSFYKSLSGLLVLGGCFETTYFSNRPKGKNREK